MSRKPHEIAHDIARKYTDPKQPLPSEVQDDLQELFDLIGSEYAKELIVKARTRVAKGETESIIPN
jgi:hypothetical protein